MRLFGCSGAAEVRCLAGPLYTDGWRLFGVGVDQATLQTLKHGQRVLVCIHMLPPPVVVHQLIHKPIVVFHSLHHLLFSEFRMLEYQMT